MMANKIPAVDVALTTSSHRDPEGPDRWPALKGAMRCYRGGITAVVRLAVLLQRWIN